MCLYPKLIDNGKYRSTKKNGGVVPPLPLREFNGKMVKDTRVSVVPVGCGKCIACMKKKAREWQVRLLEEVKDSKDGMFITLTFSNEAIKELTKTSRLEGYDRENEMVKKAVRRFLERWRKKYKKSVKHWFVTELGGGRYEHIHVHGIIWTDKSDEEIRERWEYGHIWIPKKEKRYLNERTATYITKYMQKQDVNHREYKPIILTSAGIGKGYLKTRNAELNKYGRDTNEAYITKSGHKMALPIYYRNHIYSDEEREKLWISKLEKGERWVMGEKVENDEEYYLMLEQQRKKNAQLGYGNDEINWERRIYENDRRNLIYMERIKNAK